MELDSESARRTIAELGELADLAGYGYYIAMFTYGGREPDPDPWGITREYMQDHEEPANTERLIALFQRAGCDNEIDAVRWLMKHEDKGGS